MSGSLLPDRCGGPTSAPPPAPAALLASSSQSQQLLVRLEDDGPTPPSPPFRAPTPDAAAPAEEACHPEGGRRNPPSYLPRLNGEEAKGVAVASAPPASSSSSSSSSENCNRDVASTGKKAPPQPAPPPSREELRRRVYRAFCEIPEPDKSAYLRAMERAPELVLRESDPIRYLQRESGDAKAAAMLLAAYWNQRSALFGDRSLLPMTLSGNGALSDSDIEVLKGGSQVFLPSDEKGRTVLYVDDSRDNGGCTSDSGNPEKPDSTQQRHQAKKDARMAQYRCAFALYTQAAQQEKPIVMVRYSSEADGPVLDRKTKKSKSSKNRKVCDMFEYMPAKLDSMICLYAPPGGGGNSGSEGGGGSGSEVEEDAATDVALPGVKTLAPTSTVAAPHGPHPKPKVKESAVQFNPLFEEYRGRKRFWGDLHNVVGGDTPEETLDHMRRHGFSREGLPVSAGGTWVYANHESWVDRRQAKELVEEKVGQQKAAALHEFAKLAALSGGTTHNKKRKGGGASSAASHDYKLKASAAAMAAAASASAALAHKRSKNASVAPEDDALPAIAKLAAATSTARVLQRKDRKRRLDVIYSRNRRQREKHEEGELQAQCADLKRANAALRKGERRLMQSLADAHRAIDEHFSGAEQATAADEPSQHRHHNPAAAEVSATSRSRQESSPAAATNNSAASAAGVSPGDLQNLLQLLAHQEACATQKAAPPPPPSPPQPAVPTATGSSLASNGIQVLLPIVQRMLTGEDLGSQDILAVIMMLMGHLQTTSRQEAVAQQQQRAAAAAAAAAAIPARPSGNDALLLQLLGAVVKGEQQQQLQQQQQAQLQQQQQQAQHQAQQLQRRQQQQQLNEANLLSGLLSLLQGSNSTPPVSQVAVPQPHLPHRHSTSNHQTSHEALFQLLLPKDLPAASAAPPQAPHARPARATAAAPTLDLLQQRQVPKLVHRHSQSSSSGASSLSDRDSNQNSFPPANGGSSPQAPPAPAPHVNQPPSAANNSNYTSTPNLPSSAQDASRNGGGLDILQLMLALSGSQNHSAL